MAKIQRHWFTLVVSMLAGCAPAGGRHSPRTIAPPVVPLTADGVHALVASPGARATLVNLWATWCAPCREEMPALLKVARARRAEGLRLVLISTDAEDQLPQVARFLAAQGVTDTSYLAAGSEMAFIDGLDPRWSGALPATFVYDAAGRLEAFWEGAANEARFDQSIQTALTHPVATEKPTP